jgi:phosphinothricin acetyltransferase
MNFVVVPMTAAHWPEVATIYQEGIDTGHATFATAPPDSWDAWCAGKLNACSLAALAGNRAAGWAALSPTSTRPVYAGVAEVSVYVAATWRGQGLGTLLMAHLISVSEMEGIWTLQAGIFPENQASITLHIHHGFREVGRRERIGKMAHGPLAGCWRDVLLLERRSRVAGV